MKKFRIGDPLRATWEHDGSGEVDRFELQLDAQPPVMVPAVIGAPQTYLLAGVGAGDHTVTVRGCNGFECGETVREAFEVAPVVPGAPHHLKFGASDDVLDVPKLAALAQAWATIAFGQVFTEAQLRQLAEKFVQTGKPWTRGNLLALLDAQYEGV